jgi:hypothetical protein
MKKIFLIPALFVLFSALATAHCGSCGAGDNTEAKSCSSAADTAKVKAKAKAADDAKKSSSKAAACRSCCG